jgi:cell division FtsZ-interacting protein ZapD
MKKEPKDINKEMKHYLGVLNEMHGENLKGIREGFEILNKKFDRQEKTLDSHTKILSSHTEMIGSLMENMEIIKGDISTIKGGLKKKVDYDDFLSLVRRVQKLEGKV